MKYPNTRLGWSKFYAARFNKLPNVQSEQLAIWYLLLHLSLDNGVLP